jgi:uncharacterized protein YaaN involved in tellurite resistance
MPTVFGSANPNAQQPIQQSSLQPVAQPIATPQFGQMPSLAIDAPAQDSNAVAIADRRDKLAKFKPDELQQIHNMKNALASRDMNALTSYGSNAGDVVNRLADTVLENTKATALDDVGTKVNAIMLKARELDVGQIGKVNNPGFLGKILPWLRVTKEKIIVNYESIATQIDKYVAEIKSSSQGMQQSVRILEGMGQSCVTYFNQLEYLIAAGHSQMIDLYQEIDQKKVQFSLTSSPDQLEYQAFQQLQNYTDTLDKKISDLERIQQVVYMQIPQIHLMIKNSVDIQNQFQNIISATIPIWKQQFTLSLVLDQQKRGAEIIKETNDFTNDILKKNADLLRATSVDVATQGQRGVVDFDTLKHVHEQTIGAMNDVTALYKKGREDRQKISQDISAMREDFKKSLNGKIA